MKIDFIDFNKLFFERLSWVYNLLKNHNSSSFKIFWKNLCKNGVYALIIFDNYKYYSGAIVEKKDDELKIMCPNSLLNLKNRPTHWNKEADKYFDLINTFASSKDYSNINLTVMDLRHFMRIINSENPMKVFYKLSYNGVIYSEFNKTLWLKVKLKYSL